MTMASDAHTNGDLTRATIADRLSVLRSDLLKGEARLRQLDEERHALRDQLLRIDGAITALIQLTTDDPASSRAPERAVTT